MPKCVRTIFFVCFLTFLASCNTLKFVPEDKMLLNKTAVHMVDRKEVKTKDLSKFIQQKQNTEIFGFWKLQLDVYDLAGMDSTKWINRTLKKMGEPPEIFDPFAAGNSIHYLTKAMQNMGYFDASVDTTMQVKNRKLKLTYNVTGREPYILTSYSVRLHQNDLRRIATSNDCLVKENERFDANILDDERQRITTEMRNNGYYFFEKDYLTYQADSAYGNHTVSVQLQLREYQNRDADSLWNIVFRQFVVENVNYVMDEPDFIRQSVLDRVSKIVPGHLYNQEMVERTYADLTALGPVKYTDISFRQTGSNTLECNILLSRSKLNSVSVEAEGTFSAGDWGVAGGAGYTNKNLFHGAEVFTLSANAAYEWRKNTSNIFEVKAEASLAFPKAPKVAISYQFQNRPDEFTRTIVNAGLSYLYKPYKSRWQHNFSLVDIGYIYLPWVSPEFKERFLNENNPIRSSFEQHLILGWGYNANFTTYNPLHPYRSYVTLSFGVETAGNLLYGISELFNLPKNDEGEYSFFNVPFSQYVKGDFNLVWHGIINERHRFVGHFVAGIAAPYGNLSVVPFEKRYFGGGANSVRGWSIRTLGPGAYHGVGANKDYNYQVGDIKLETSLEYRWRVWSIIELAAFTDAGNIWTFYDYESQPAGAFTRDFYKEIAWAYGGGIRLDFKFFIFRFDIGTKLYDPGRLYLDGKAWRTPTNGLNWKEDCALHFAIGYPF